MDKRKLIIPAMIVGILFLSFLSAAQQPPAIEEIVTKNVTNITNVTLILGDIMEINVTNITTIESLATVGNFIVSGDEICMEDGKPIIYFFGSTGCGHCRWEYPVIENVTSQFKGYISFHDNMNNFTADREIFDKYNPRGSVPTIVLGCEYYRVGSGANLGEDEEAKVLTALICDLTDNKPADVCPTVTPSPTPTVTPTPTPSPMPTITPTPTVSPSPTPIPLKKPQLEAIYELHPGKTKGEIEIKIYIRNVGDVNASNVKFEIDNPRFLNPIAVAGCQKLGDTIVVSATKLEPHEELVGSYSVTVPTDRDTEIRGRLSYTDESGLEEIVCIIIIKILEALFAQIPMLGIGATFAALGIAYLVIQRRKL